MRLNRLLIMLVALLCVYILLNTLYGIGFVVGDSMEPTLRDGQPVVISKLQAPRYGDMVAVWLYGDGRFEQVVHRIVSINDDGLLTLRGDNCEQLEYCWRADIRGVVIWPGELQ